MASTIKSIFAITKIAVTGHRCWFGFGLFATILTLKFTGVWISVQMIAWNKNFYDALEQRDVTVAISELGVFALLTALAVLLYLCSDWLQKKLLILWREKLTLHVKNAWFSGKAYWHLRPGFSTETMDNPDQRIANDCKLFVHHFISQTLDLITSIVELFSYVAVLWTLSSFALNFTFFGMDFSLPRYMVWMAFFYVAISSFITHVLGRPIKNIVFQQERFEANFRHALIQVRESADQIAQDSGEKAEKRRLHNVFDDVKKNWIRLANAEFVLGLFSRPYYTTVLRIPTFLALPAYFAGAVTLGGLMQLASAFSRVTTTLSWFIFSYRSLAEFVAVTERLQSLLDATQNLSTQEGVVKDIQRHQSESAKSSIALHNLLLTTPQGKEVNHIEQLSIQQGERVWIRGNSGAGKSTLLATLSGLWPFGTGTVAMPKADVLALPQLARMFPEGLLHTLVYPENPEDFSRHAIETVLHKVGLAHCINALDVHGSESFAGLSGGEKQRIALARVLLKKPQILLLDEATSALDKDNEENMLSLLKEHLPQTTIVCVAHSAPEALAPYRTVSLTPNETNETDLQ